MNAAAKCSSETSRYRLLNSHIFYVRYFFFAKTFDNFYGVYDGEKEEKKSMLQLTLEIIGMMWLYGGYNLFC